MAVTTAADRAALEQRLRAIVPALLEGEDATSAHLLSAGPLLDRLALSVGTAADRVWLLCAAAAGGYPTADEVRAAQRNLRLAESADRIAAVLSAIAVTAVTSRGAAVEAELVVGAVAVDVDFCARNDHNTGIQRVVRSTMPHWGRDHAPVLLRWSDDGLGYRRLTPRERSRVLEWNTRDRDAPDEATAETRRLVLPWRGTLVVPEVPAKAVLERLSALARFSGTEVTMVGHDAIPIVSAHTAVDEESDRFAHFLSVVKHATHLSGVSASAAGEFRGFCRALASQGLRGPAVVSVSLPSELPAVVPATAPDPASRPTVLMVGSLEPRKNQYAVLHAAELLWREGVDFELLIIGGGSAWFLAGFLRDVRAMQRAGRPLRVLRGADDAQLRSAYDHAAFVVFPSLHEGFGLPVAEALAAGTPVVTTRYGSTAEIAADGGCVLVDPRDDLGIAAALRELLAHPERLAELRAEIALRPRRGWADYADELWTAIVAGTRGAA